MPRPIPLPAANTPSARLARAAFFCDLCQKGYSRMNEFEAHQSSYDHQHKKRLLEMKQMQRQVKDSLPRKEEKGMLMSIKLGGGKEKEKEVVGGGGGGGFKKKGGFKKMNAFVAVEGGGVEVDAEVAEKEEAIDIETKAVDEVDSDLTDCEDYYDPHHPTGCHPGCTANDMR